jgi:RHS repeat-associated protein
MSQSRYLPYGQERCITGALTTDFGFTGQRSERGFGLSDYNARYYDPYLNRFISPDSIVPNPTQPQNLNRYAYTLNNPVRYRDPSGHCVFAFPFDTLACIAVGMALVLGSGTAHETTPEENTNGLIGTALIFGPPAVLGAKSVAESVAIGCAADPECAEKAAKTVDAGRQSAEAVATPPASQELPPQLSSPSEPFGLLPDYGGANPWDGPTTSFVLQEDTTMYRVWGGKSPQTGEWLTTTPPPLEAC